MFEATTLYLFLAEISNPLVRSTQARSQTFSSRISAGLVVVDYLKDYTAVNGL